MEKRSETKKSENGPNDLLGELTRRVQTLGSVAMCVLCKIRWLCVKEYEEWNLAYSRGTFADAVMHFGGRALDISQMLNNIPENDLCYRCPTEKNLVQVTHDVNRTTVITSTQMILQRVRLFSQTNSRSRSFWKEEI